MRYFYLKLILAAFVISVFVLFPFYTDAVNLQIGIGNNRTASGIADYIGIIYRFGTMIVGVVAVVMIVIGGIQYAASAGNNAAISSAKETITSAIIGLVIVLFTYLILGTVNSNLITLKDPAIKDIDFGSSEASCKGHCLPAQACRDRYNSNKSKEEREKASTECVEIYQKAVALCKSKGCSSLPKGVTKGGKFFFCCRSR